MIEKNIMKYITNSVLRETFHQITLQIVGVKELTTIC